MKLFILLVTLIAIANCASKDRNNKPYKLVCYWGSWSFYWWSDGHFEAETIDSNTCTHLNYGFAKLVDNKIQLADTYLDPENNNDGAQGMYKRFNNLRNENPHLTTLISIGGWNEGSVKYSKMAMNKSTRKIFIDSVVEFLQKHNFDGLDLDWEYPGYLDQGKLGGNPADKKNYVELIKELHEAFQPKGYLLTAAVSAGKQAIDIAYDVSALSKYFDFINIMTYDFHGAWEQETGANAPLHPLPGAKGIDLEYTVEYGVNYWLKLGADPKKIVMGMPFYGRTWTLAGQDNGYKSKAVGEGGNAGKYTQQAGVIGYNELCVLFKAGGWTVKRNDTFKVPYAVKANQWVSFDDAQSIKDKVTFLKSKGLGGGMIWALENDDHNNTCGQGTFPLLRTIAHELNNDAAPGPDNTVSPPRTTVPPTWQPPATSTGNPDLTTTQKSDSTTTEPGEEFVCKKVGYFPDPKDKHIFHECVDDGHGKLTKFTFHCAKGTIYDPELRVCKNEK